LSATSWPHPLEHPTPVKASRPHSPHRIESNPSAPGTCRGTCAAAGGGPGAAALCLVGAA
jgi:hypothetical protein